MTNSKKAPCIQDEVRSTVSRATSTDAHVGKRIRLRRTLLGFSQEKLGELIGITFQQIQKYERGTNRVGASRLYDIARALEVPITFFFEDLTPPQHATSSARTFGFSETRSPFHREYANASPNRGAPDLLSSKETTDLIRAYYSITDIKVRKNVLELIRSMNN